MSRLHAVEAPLPGSKDELKRLAGTLVTAERPGDWAQALMDLGAVICRPKAPLCDRCPVSAFCEAYRRGDQESFPRKTAKAERPRRWGVAYVATRGDEVALVRRPPRGLLGGMLALPASEWLAAPHAPEPPAPGAWRRVGTVEHVFTHFALTLEVVTAEVEDVEGAIWTPMAQAGEGLPSVFLKALRGLARPALL